MPAFPTAQGGRLVVRSSGPSGSPDLGREWTAQAGICDTPSTLQISAEQPGAGGVLVRVALSSQKTTSYLIVPVIQGSSTAPGAQMGVQVYTKVGSFAYQAQDGSVDVSSFRSNVTGRFAVTLTEITSNARLRFVGSFRDIPVMTLDPSLCAPASPPSLARSLTAPGCGPGLTSVMR